MITHDVSHLHNGLLTKVCRTFNLEVLSKLLTDVRLTERRYSPRLKKFKAQQSSGNVMLKALFDMQQAPLLAEVKELDVSINAQWYTQTLDKLYMAITNIR
ncbi:hypothetical protein TNCV_3157671 [Trichonephila clavipes]|nr:hypothetical protein TNCV_3157671 [Trichonephila clavipes]